MVTEMWLSNKIEDDTWVKCTVLNNDNLKLANANRIGRKGGGIALVYCNNLKVRHLEDENQMSFEYAIWGLQHKRDQDDNYSDLQTTIQYNESGNYSIFL